MCIRDSLYAIMGSKVYGMPYEECREFYPDGSVNAAGKERRTTMKSVLLGIMYERGAAAIGEQFDKSAQWAQELIDNFYKSFPKVAQLRLQIEKMAEEYGYVTTVCGRKRRLPDMQIPNKDDYKYQDCLLYTSPFTHCERVAELMPRSLIRSCCLFPFRLMSYCRAFGKLSLGSSLMVSPPLLEGIPILYSKT